MCLALPGKVVKIFEENGLKMGKIDYSGTRKEACLEYVIDVKPGQYVVVHAGFAIGILDEKEAQKTLDIWQQMVQFPNKRGNDTL